MNRISHGFASDPCSVVYQQRIVVNTEDPTIKRKVCQFSWVCEGKPAPDKTSNSYKQAESVAKQVLLENKWHDIMPSNMLFFHNTSVDPNWSYKRIATIGNHIFYTTGD